MKKRILLATGIFPPDIGGPATMIAQLARELSRLGFLCSVLTYTKGPVPCRAVVQPDSIQVWKIPLGGSRFSGKALFFRKLLQLSNDADLIYATDTYSVGLFTVLTKLLKGKKFILRFAGDSAWESSVACGETSCDLLTFQDSKGPLRQKLRKAVRSLIMRHANGVIAVSGFMKLVALKIGVLAERIRVIYNAVDFPADTENREGSARRDGMIGIPENATVIGTACRLTKWKGVGALVRVFAKIAQDFPNAHLIVLGDGPELASLTSLADRSCHRDRIHFTGRVPHNEIFVYYKQMDIFVLNSLYEGLSHTLLEVVQASVPVIATNVGGNPEVIESGKSGILIEPVCEEALTAALLKLLGNKSLRQEMSEQALKGLSRFSWKDNILQTQRFLGEILQ